MLARPPPTGQFELLAKFLPKALGQCSPDELKKAHFKIINDMIAYEETFLQEHKTAVDQTTELVAREEKALIAMDDPESSVETYLANSEECLGKELEMIRELQRKVRVFKKYLAEERAFAKKYVAPESGEPVDVRKNRSFEISDTHMLKRTSSDSLLLDD